MDFAQHKISVFEPFSDFLLGEKEEKSFQISLLDVVRLAGHACPSMVGAFLITKKAIETLYPDTGVCIRGQIKISIPALATQGATGPMSNVFGYITGAWGETGFGGFSDGSFTRRNLIQFGSSEVPKGHYRFTRTDNGDSVDISYDPSKVDVVLNPHSPFQIQWRERIKAILARPEQVISTHALTT